MPRSGGSQPIDGGGGFAVEFQPALAGAEHRSTVRLTASTRTRGRLTPAGTAAVLNVLTGYLTASKCSAIRVRHGDSGAPLVSVTPDTVSLDLLPEDGPTVAASLSGVLNVPANVSA